VAAPGAGVRAAAGEAEDSVVAGLVAVVDLAEGLVEAVTLAEEVREVAGNTDFAD